MRKRPQAILAVLSRRATMSERKLCANTRIHDINGRTIKNTTRVSGCVSKIYTKQKGGSVFSKDGFSFILLGCPLSDCKLLCSLDQM